MSNKKLNMYALRSYKNTQIILQRVGNWDHSHTSKHIAVIALRYLLKIAVYRHGGNTNVPFKSIINKLIRGFSVPTLLSHLYFLAYLHVSYTIVGRNNIIVQIFVIKASHLLCTVHNMKFILKYWGTVNSTPIITVSCFYGWFHFLG